MGKGISQPRGEDVDLLMDNFIDMIASGLEQLSGGGVVLIPLAVFFALVAHNYPRTGVLPA